MLLSSDRVLAAVSDFCRRFDVWMAVEAFRGVRMEQEVLFVVPSRSLSDT